MPRRSLLTPAERAELFAFPADEADLIRYYTLSAPDLSVIQRRRGDHNRLGFTVLLCCLRHPGFILPPDTDPPFPLLALIGRQLQIRPDVWSQYAQRAQTRREHLVELRNRSQHGKCLVLPPDARLTDRYQLQPQNEIYYTYI